jgi:hypothetical protein
MQHLFYALVNFAYKKLRNKKKDIFSDTKGQNARWKQEDEQKEITSRLMHYPE